MNARITPTDKIARLTNYQFKLIIRLATSKEPVCVRADRIRALSYCTDAVKFEVLKKSRKIDDETYQALYDIYFGVVEKDDDKPEPKKNKGGRPSTWDEADVLTLIHYYNKGTKASVLADMFHKSENVIYARLYRLKRDEKYKEMFTMSKEKAAPKPQEQEKKFEETIQSVDAGSRKEIPEPSTMPKAFTATGKGFMSTEGGLKLDEEPITALLRQEIVKKGLAQFYAEVEITIRPVAPVGMIVEVED